MSSVVGAVSVWPVESVAIAAISVCQPRVSLSISIDNGIASVAIAVVVEPAIGKGEWDNSLLLAISGLHNLLGDHGVGVVRKVAIGVRVTSIATVCEPRVSLGI